jgi:hypothetical protein
MVSHYPYLRTVLYAQPFCAILSRQNIILGVTPEEREKIVIVALGGEWP